MPILALGISHRSATVDLLERLAYTDEDYAKAYRRASDQDGLDEAVILSTCNRVEVYASVHTYHAGFQALKQLLCESRDVDPEELVEALHSHYEDDAAEYLFGVAGGLDSMVLGEPQILSQVREAHRRAKEEGGVGPALAALFNAAARAGRRIRSETAVGAAPDAFVEAGARLASDAVGGLEGRTAIVVGAGSMSALAVRHLRGRDVGLVRVLNRNLDRARALADRADAEAADLAALPAALASADLVISATGAAGLLITEAMVREAVRHRGSGARPLFLLDLAVPRDVDPSVAGIPGAQLVDIEGVRAVLDEREPATAEEVQRAHDIVDDEVRRFALRRRSERLAPLIRAMRERGEDVQAGELARFRSRLADLTPDERDAVESVARGIVSKLLHDPVVRLKELSGPGTEGTYAKMLADLFGIDLPAE